MDDPRDGDPSVVVGGYRGSVNATRARKNRLETAEVLTHSNEARFTLVIGQLNTQMPRSSYSFDYLKSSTRRLEDLPITG